MNSKVTIQTRALARAAKNNFQEGDTYEKMQFYYHPDHLDSTSYITDDKGNITQYDAYLPYGELLVDEHSSSKEMPYKFNDKEFDEETGLYYYATEKDKVWTVKKTKLSNEKYKQLQSLFNSLNENGRTPMEQRNADAKAKQKLKTLQRPWGTMR